MRVPPQIGLRPVVLTAEALQQEQEALRLESLATTPLERFVLESALRFQAHLREQARSGEGFGATPQGREFLKRQEAELKDRASFEEFVARGWRRLVNLARPQKAKQPEPAVAVQIEVSADGIRWSPVGERVAGGRS